MTPVVLKPPYGAELHSESRLPERMIDLCRWSSFAYLRKESEKLSPTSMTMKMPYCEVMQFHMLTLLIPLSPLQDSPL